MYIYRDFLNISHRKNFHRLTLQNKKNMSSFLLISSTFFDHISFRKEQLRVEIEEFYVKGMYFYVIDEVKR